MSMTNGHKWRTAAVSNHGQASNILVESSSLLNYSPVKSNGHTSRYSFDDSQNMHVIKNWKFLKKKPSPATSARLNDSECSQQVRKVKLQFISVIIYDILNSIFGESGRMKDTARARMEYCL